MSRAAVWRWVRVPVALAVLAVVAWRLGAGPFVDGVRAVDAWALAAAAALSVPATLACAWRWKLIARGLGVDLPFPRAVAAYARSIFLNLAVPGGVVGDVHRGFRHGRATGLLGRALRAVAWERGAGQVVQMALTVGVLLVLPSPVRWAMPAVAAVLLAGAAALVLAARTARSGRGSRVARALATVRSDVRHGLLARRAWPGVVVSSVVVVACHTATFMVAARTVGTPASTSTMLPLALLVMAAMALPNVGGWGPREGAAAWVFGAAGMGADRGVAAAVAFGVMVLVASLPGAVILAVTAFRGTPAPDLPEGAVDA